MQIYPAIDIKGGRVVRLLEGENLRETKYSDDPIAQARQFVSSGANWIHVVDMDRAFRSGGDNMEVVRQIASMDDVNIQLGGDIAEIGWARDAARSGADRVVLGTTAAVEPQLFASLVAEIGAVRCALAIDTRGGEPALRGGGIVKESVADLVNRALSYGVKTIVYRNLSKDGLVSGADVAGARSIVGLGADVIVAGGVSGTGDLRQAAAAGLVGAIVGRALYEGRFTLQEAIECSR